MKSNYLHAKQLATQLWNDQRGAVISIELILLSTIVVIGIIVGLATYRDSVMQELADTGIAISVLDQSYSMTTDLDPSTGGTQSTFDQDFGNSTPGMGVTPRVNVSVTVFDSTYEDNNDSGDNIVAGREGTSVADPAGDAPAGITFTAPVNEGP